MADLQAYLAAKYMSGAKADAILEREDPHRKKKKKRTQASSSAKAGQGLVIADDDGAFGVQDREEEEYKPGALLFRRYWARR